jgi:hypothetical protein
MVHQQPRRDFNFVGHGNFSCSASLSFFNLRADALLPSLFHLHVRRRRTAPLLRRFAEPLSRGPANRSRAMGWSPVAVTAPTPPHLRLLLLTEFDFLYVACTSPSTS